jgi:hypothetical protein
MDEHPLLKVLNSTPINRQAAVVARQKFCDREDRPMSREELAAITSRLQRKQRLLKLVLGIRTKAQHVNTLYKFNNKIPQFRFKAEPRALVEYVRVGKAIQRINAELAELRSVRRFVAQAEQAWRAQSTPQPADPSAPTS